jgi:RNA polymerase-interacting CarD/CdnL/TRCF family regulator
MLFSPSMGICRVLSIYPNFADDGTLGGVIYELDAPAGRIKLLAENVRQRTRPLMSRGTALQVLGIIGDRLDEPLRETPAQRAQQARKAEQSGDPIESAKVVQRLIMRADGYGNAPPRISGAETRLRERLISRLCDELRYVLMNEARVFSLYSKTVSCEDFIRAFSRRLAAQATVRANPAAVEENLAMYAGRETDSLNRSWKALLRRLSPNAKVSVDETKRRQIAEKQLAILRTLDDAL